MIPDQWQKAKELFDAALKRSPGERLRLLDEHCEGDEELRREVASLLANSEAAASFLEQPAIGEVAEAIVGNKEKTRLNQSLSHYKIIELLGTGGMGEVFLAEDTRLHRKVALKVLPENIVADKERLRRFEQEAHAASALNHPNILTVHEFGFETSVHFLVTEFVDGETLREKINEAELSLTNALNITEQIAFALSAAHTAGIVHRDIKPENVMIRRDGIVKVLDFGLAKLIERKAISFDAEAETRALVKTNPGVIMGTVSYMSPEQARGKETDARTDIFSLAVVLYEMLTGRLPFAGETMNDSIAAILTREPPPLAQYISHVPTELQRIVRKALTKERDERYQTARDLMIDLKALRRDLDLRGELERAAAPNKNYEQITEKDSAQQTQIPAKAKLTDTTVAVSTKSGAASDIHSTSSAEYVISEIKQHQRGFLGALSILLLAAIGFGYWFYSNSSTSIDTRQINSIAVLPFENGSNDANLDYLSDGLSESLIDNLSQLPQLKVIARSSSFKYRGKDINLQAVVNALGVQAIVTGKVVQRGDNLTIRVEMIDARDNRQLWGEQYNRKALDALAVQQDIAHAVASNLRVKLDALEQQRLNKHPTENAAAYQEYLKGRYYSTKSTADGLQKSVEHFQRAIEFDPNYALAYAGLANAYWYVSDLQFAPRDVMPKAKAAALKAIEIDDTLAEVHAGLGIFKTAYDWDWAGAEKEFRRALELNPDDATTRHFYSWYLALMGRHDESLAEAKRAQQLDPLSLAINSNVGRTLYWARRYDEASAQLQKALELDSNFWLAHTYLSEVYLETGHYQEALSESQKARQIDNNHYVLARLGLVYARMGRRADALKIINELKEMSKHSYVSAHSIAVIYVGLGEKDVAFEWLEKAFGERAESVGWLKVDPRLDSLRDDPRFQDLLRRVGLSQ